MIFFIVLYSLIAIQEPHVKNFLKESSKSVTFNINLLAVDCKSGKLKDTYVLAQNDKVVLKQLSQDGSIGPVCVK